MIADFGRFQRLPFITSNWHLMKEYSLTGEKIVSDEAVKLGIVSRVFESEEEMKKRLFRVAQIIASKSPVAIAGIKHTINRSRNQVIDDGLISVRKLTASQLFTDDVANAIQATLTKSLAKYQKL